MPPKKKVDPGAKAKAAKKAKNVDDRTFGLKNKNKSKKVQEFVKQVENQSEAARKKQDLDAKRKLAEKKAADAAKLEAAALFNPVIAQKVPFGVDPKSVLCEAFKKNLCNRGKKCKFSHDLEIGRKDVKKDLYTDDRKAEEKEADTMDNWDEEKLRLVIMSKHGNPKTTTDIVCKFFTDAVENGKYGWFWVCPNGGNECKYRHSLPPGFVLKTKEEKRLEKLALDAQPKITLEDFIETERNKLDKTKLVPISWESFTKWKEQHRLDKFNARAKQDEKNKRQITGKEAILKRFADKFYKDDELSADQGTEWDLSQFKKAVEDVEGETVLDYGDGSTAFAENQKLPAKNAEEETKSAKSEQDSETQEPEEQKSESHEVSEVDQASITESPTDEILSEQASITVN